MKPHKVMVVGGYDRSLLNFRGPLLAALAQAGHDVVAAAPAETSEVPRGLKELGVRFAPVPLARAGLNPVADLGSLLRLRGLFRREDPDVVLSYTIKPVIYGSLAASWEGVPRIYALITGLGAAFHTPGLKGRVLRAVAVKMYRTALARCTRVFVQNQEIAELFIRERIAAKDKIMVVAGSGVDTEHFSAVPPPVGRPTFLLLARMLRDKGVGEYVTAARLLKSEFPAARFLLVGDVDRNPASVRPEELAQWHREGVVEHHPAVGDVRPLLAQCSAYVLPSYHEGMPRSVLEAMATGRPVITTDTIGCRETVINAGPTDQQGVRTGDNGLLVPVRRVDPLAAAMRRMLLDDSLRERLGRRGREIAVQQFDVRRINDLMRRAMDLAPMEVRSGRLVS